MTPAGGGSEDASTDDEDGDPPSLDELVEKVNERRGRSVRGGESETEDATAAAGMSDAQSEPSHSVPGWESHGFGTDPRTEALLEIVGEAGNLLVLGPLLCPAEYDICTKLTRALPDGLENLLLVTLTESPDERLNVFRGHLDDLPNRTAIINVGDSIRSGSRETVSTLGDGEITIETISDPTDLMRIGISISRQLSGWEGAVGPTAVCLHSLTALLQFADNPKSVFRFIHVLRGRIQSAGAHAHYHLDPGAHDEQLIRTFRPLFDEVLTYNEEGELHVEH